MKVKGLKTSTVLAFLLAFVLVPNVQAWVINSVTFEWVPDPSGYSFINAILVRRCVNANYHWLTSEELLPNPRQLGSWKYGVINGCVAHYPVYNVAVGDVVKIGVGASDTDPGATSGLYTHPNTRFWRCERTASDVTCTEITTPPPPSGGSNPFWYLRNNNSGGAGDIVFQYGQNGDIPVVGDWNGDGRDTPGVFRSATATWYLRNSNSGGAGNLEFVYGVPGDIPVVGDWNGDGIDTIGVFRNDTRTWYLRNSNSGGSGNVVFEYGRPGYTPIVGDWNGDGKDTIGVFQRETRTWYLRNSNSGGTADMEFQYGETQDIPVAGDWNRDGKDTIGVFRSAEEKWYLRNTNAGGAADLVFPYGKSDDKPVVGDWDVDGRDTIGVVRAEATSELISNLQVSSGEPYEIGVCSLGARYYVDRDFTITGFSNSDYDGLTCIKTANDDKSNSSNNLIEFDLNSPTRIYIYWDRRSDDDYRPGWMRQLWDPNSKEVYVSDDSMDWFEVSSCDSTPGHIVLGGPFSDGGGSGVKSMYVVAFRPIEDEGDKLCSAADTLMPTGSIISPQDQQEFGPNDQITFSATASDNSGGSEVKQVHFWVRHAAPAFGDWYFAGADSSSPYSINWARPSDLRSQIMEVGIHVEDNAGNYCIDPDPSGNNTCFNTQSRLTFVYRESKNNDSITENWIPKDLRFYSNQRALTIRYADKVCRDSEGKVINPGDCKCAGASAAMLMAMLGRIAGDYDTMAGKAEEIYINLPDNKGDTMLDELKGHQGLDIALNEYDWDDKDAGWATIKAEIDNGQPMILLSGKFTDKGHYMVIVSYREQGSTRQVIVYDPYGRWQGKTGAENYDKNAIDANSFKGQWAYYDINLFWPNLPWPLERRNVFLFIINTAQQMNTIPSIERATTIPTTPPDVISTESEDLGTYEGVFAYFSEIYLPLVTKSQR